MRRFFVESDNIRNRKAFVTGGDARHIQKVLRLKSGDNVILFDGSGLEYQAVIENIEGHCVQLGIEQTVSIKTESSLRLTVAQALLKDKKMDRLVRQLTELGMTRWIPYTAVRSIPKPDTVRIADRCTRWQKIARESLKQCRRSRLPEIDTVRAFQETLFIGSEHSRAFIFWENATEPLPTPGETTKTDDPLFIMLGPEGGFEPAEIQSAADHGFIPVSLGPRILKADTAPLAACALIQYLFGDMGA